MNWSETKEYQRLWYHKNKDKILAKSALKKEQKAAYDKQRRLLKGTQLREYDALRANQPERRALKRNWSRKRHLSIKQAKPNWLSEFDEFFIKEIYHLAVISSNILGINFQVDHIVPLHGKLVCGLHVPSNLQILDATTNIKKKNKFELV